MISFLIQDLDDPATRERRDYVLTSKSIVVDVAESADVFVTRNPTRENSGVGREREGADHEEQV
jgi:hypothetical protein